MCATRPAWTRFGTPFPLVPQAEVNTLKAQVAAARAALDGMEGELQEATQRDER